MPLGLLKRLLRSPGDVRALPFKTQDYSKSLNSEESRAYIGFEGKPFMVPMCRTFGIGVVLLYSGDDERVGRVGERSRSEA